jgi:hypothetical protein
MVKTEMKRKLALVAAVLVAVLSPMLVNQAFAHGITVFTPINYAIPPVLPLPIWGDASSPGPPATTSFLNPVEGWTSLNIFPGSPAGSWAESWYWTGWTMFNSSLPLQSGSVTADTWINYTIKGQAGIRAFLFVYEWTPPSTSGTTGTFEWWREVAGNAIPGNWESSFDLNVNPNDKSNLGNPFSWTPGSWYVALVLLQAVVGNPASSFISVAPPLIPAVLPQPPLPVPPSVVGGKFDDILFITYLSSPNDFVSDPGPTIVTNPPLGPIGTSVNINGTGYQPFETINVTLNGQTVATTTTDANGFFDIPDIDIPAGTPLGQLVFIATGATGDGARSFFDVFAEIPPLLGDLNGDGKVSLADLQILAKGYGQTDPNIIDPPASGTQVTYAGVTLLAAIVPLGLFIRRQKEHRRLKRDTQGR